MKFDWRRTSREQFEDAVNLLLERKHEDAEITFAPDGRGGDEGVDFLAKTRRALYIYQLKHYTDGLKSTKAGRRRAIQESFETATTKHSPSSWVLVLPAQITVPERRWIMALKAPAGRKQPHISVMDLSKLENLLTKYPDIRSHLDREPVLDAIEERTIEHAVVRDVAEVRDRATRLASRGADLDPDWDMQIFASPSSSWVLPVPRSKRVLERNPLGLELKIDPSKMTADLRATFDRTIGFGSSDAVRIPREAIVEQISTGPSWQWGPLEGDFELQPILQPNPDRVFLLELFDRDNTSLGEHEGTIVHAAPGAIGASVEVEFYGGLRLRWMFPTDKSAPANVDINVDVHKLDMADARDSLRLNRLLVTETSRLEIRSDAGTLTSGEIDNRTVELPRDLRVLEEFADDMQFLLGRMGMRRKLPVEVRDIDRATARGARIAAEGGCAFLPPPFTFSGEIDTGGSIDNERQLRQTLEVAGSIIFTRPSMKISIAGIVVDIGPVAAYVPLFKIANRDVLLAALENGTADGMRIEFGADHNVGWRIRKLDSTQETLEGPWDPQPWSGVDLMEHPGLGLDLTAEKLRLLVQS